jgi:hypothetical protein
MGSKPNRRRLGYPKMMNEAYASRTSRLAIRPDHMVFDVPSEEQGVDEVVYAIAQPTGESTARLNLGGAWRDLIDADAMLEALDRLGREAPPTPPITSID